LKENVNQENLISIFSRSIEVQSPLKLFLEPERRSRKIAEVATASAGVKLIQGRKKNLNPSNNMLRQHI